MPRDMTHISVLCTEPFPERNSYLAISSNGLVVASIPDNSIEAHEQDRSTIFLDMHALVPTGYYKN